MRDLSPRRELLAVLMIVPLVPIAPDEGCALGIDEGPMRESAVRMAKLMQ